MSRDIYGQVKFNPGEQLVSQDFDAAQRTVMARLFDSILERLIHARNGTDEEFNSENGTDVSTSYCYAPVVGGAHPKPGSANNKIKIAAGTLLQKIAASDGTEPKLVPYTFTGTDELTIANGDATNPRVDLIQMALSWVDTGLTNRVFSQDAVKASLDLSTKTTNDNTKVQAKNPGAGGNNISISFAKRASGTGVTYSENGNAILIQYQDGVSTVADVEAAIIASSTLIEILSTGTGTNVLHDPVDSFAYTHLASGADAVRVTQSFNKTRAVQCTLSVKQGTPAASPAYPTIDAGAVAIAAIVVPAAFTWTLPLQLFDTASGAVMHDMRIPLGVRIFKVNPTDFLYNSANWALQSFNRSIKCTSNTGSPSLYIQCPIRRGRLVAIDMISQNMSTTSLFLSGLDDRPGQTPQRLCSLAAFLNEGGGAFVTHHAAPGNVEAPQINGPTVTPTSVLRPPVWANGTRWPFEAKTLDGATASQTSLILEVASPAVNAEIGQITFYVAEGL